MQRRFDGYVEQRVSATGVNLAQRAVDELRHVTAEPNEWDLYWRIKSSDV